MPEETKNDEILEAINAYADHNKKQLDSIRTDIQQFRSVTEKRFDSVETDIKQIKSVMVTKDYLDEKLADFRGDLVVLTRKEDKKVMALVDVLKQRKLIDDADVKKIMAMEPFPQSL
ncbi:MAG: hypothetical protein A2Y67_03555 [Candidatus Buchananbacteria bacterium RBG_13_39_9]|uniref:Uncharacterized protein n=1 Tax=Candidatus Buchananbacteria bacterium RBG_13_39_9 TaxID=1797531 RepID=A0A1G1XUF1_9BACT|nr:MAG: hypothetical protein A2Y67_03555 [Candidatus Buchananbacteria bacterium RBG_13_39_9]